MKILLATDGSAHSKASVEEIANRTFPANTKVRIVSAYEKSSLTMKMEPMGALREYNAALDKKALKAAEKVAEGAANNFTTLGALVITFSVMALAEVGRAMRFINILFALWLIVAMFLINAVPSNALWNAIISGVLLIALSFRKGKIQEKYGTFDRYIV